MNIKTIHQPFAALVALIGLSPCADAILFQNLPATAPGDQYVFKLVDFDNGSLYTPLPLNSAVGFGQGGASATLAAGTSALDGITTAQAGAAHAIAPYSGGVLTNTGLEDSWGIAAVTQIFRASDPLTPVWTAGSGPGTDNQQLTLMFYGEQDFYVKQVAAGSQTTDGINLHVDFYLQDTSDPSFTSFSNAGPRPADIAGFTHANDASFPTVTDSNGTLFTAGVPVLQMVSTPGFINPDGTLGGSATEFETTFSGTALNGSGLGTSFLSVVGGTLASAYNTNAFTDLYLPGVVTADMSVQFTSTTAGAGPFLVSSQDPLRAVVIPEPASTLGGIACALPILGSFLSRRRKA